jgi:hypothetical protein
MTPLRHGDEVGLGPFAFRVHILDLAVRGDGGRDPAAQGEQPG